jgi:hypothetical protein
VIDERNPVRVPPRRLDHRPRLRRVERGRLLGEHMLAGLERGDRHLPMLGRRGHDRDEVDVRGDELAPVVERREAELGGEFLRLLAVESGDRHHIQPCLAKGRHLHPRTPAGPDNTDFCHVGSSFE